jgi:hypothetical protein
MAAVLEDHAAVSQAQGIEAEIARQLERKARFCVAKCAQKTKKQQDLKPNTATGRQVSSLDCISL